MKMYIFIRRFKYQNCTVAEVKDLFPSRPTPSVFQCIFLDTCVHVIIYTCTQTHTHLIPEHAFSFKNDVLESFLMSVYLDLPHCVLMDSTRGFVPF